MLGQADENNIQETVAYYQLKLQQEQHLKCFECSILKGTNKITEVNGNVPKQGNGNVPKQGNKFWKFDLLES